MEDKQKKTTKILVIGAIVMIFLFIVVRVITYQASGTKGLSKYEGPVYDSIVLPKQDTKLQQYEKDQLKEQEDKYKRSEDAVFMDFKSAYAKTGAIPNEANETNISKPVTDNSLTGQPIEQYNAQPSTNNYSPVTFSSQVTKQTTQPKEELKDSEDELLQKEVIVPKDPFGTIHSKKAKAVKTKDMIRGEIYGNQKIIDGGGVIIRNTEELYLDGKMIPENSILYGVASYTGDRVNINLTRAKTRLGEQAISVPIFDNDYIQGIYFKAPQDEAVEKTKEDINEDLADQINNSRLVIKGINIAKNGVKNAADAAKKNRKLTLNDGYIVYLNINVK